MAQILYSWFSFTFMPTCKGSLDMHTTMPLMRVMTHLTPNTKMHFNAIYNIQRRARYPQIPMRKYHLPPAQHTIYLSHNEPHNLGNELDIAQYALARIEFEHLGSFPTRGIRLPRDFLGMGHDSLDSEQHAFDAFAGYTTDETAREVVRGRSVCYQVPLVIQDE